MRFDDANLSTIGPGWSLYLHCPHCQRLALHWPEHLINSKGNLTLGELARRSRCKACPNRRRGGVVVIQPNVSPCSALYGFHQSHRHHDIFFWEPYKADPATAFKLTGLDVEQARSI
jgi:hypothetical protein